MEGVLSVGDEAPDFDLPLAGGGRFRLSAHRGHPVVVYFYPKADTAGCTAQALDVEAAAAALAGADARVVGISKDPVRRLEAFAAKRALTFPLASDAETDATERYGAWVEKSMYGRRYMGIDRSTFLVGADGTLSRIWRKVKVPGHVGEILATLSS